MGLFFYRCLAIRVVDERETTPGPWPAHLPRSDAAAALARLPGADRRARGVGARQPAHHRRRSLPGLRDHAVVADRRACVADAVAAADHRVTARRVARRRG